MSEDKHRCPECDGTGTTTTEYSSNAFCEKCQGTGSTVGRAGVRCIALVGAYEAGREYECANCGITIENAEEVASKPDVAWECLTCEAALVLAPTDKDQATANPKP